LISGGPLLAQRPPPIGCAALLSLSLASFFPNLFFVSLNGGRCGAVPPPPFPFFFLQACSSFDAALRTLRLLHGDLIFPLLNAIFHSLIPQDTITHLGNAFPKLYRTFKEYPVVTDRWDLFRGFRRRFQPSLDGALFFPPLLFQPTFICLTPFSFWWISPCMWQEDCCLRSFAALKLVDSSCPPVSFPFEHILYFFFSSVF